MKTWIILASLAGAMLATPIAAAPVVSEQKTLEAGRPTMHFAQAVQRRPRAVRPAARPAVRPAVRPVARPVVRPVRPGATSQPVSQ